MKHSSSGGMTVFLFVTARVHISLIMSPFEPRSGDVKRSYNSSETPKRRDVVPRGVTILKTSHRTAGSILTAVQRSLKI